MEIHLAILMLNEYILNCIELILFERYPILIFNGLEAFVKFQFFFFFMA